MTPPRLETINLSRAALEAHLPALIALDAEVLRRAGPAYSDEAWGEAAFRAELPGKWSGSVAALYEGRLCGFWIISHRTPELHYTHRVAVAPWARFGVGTEMFHAVQRRAGRDGIRRMALSVAAGNAVAIRFYERLGFSPAAAGEIAHVMGRQVDVEPGSSAYRTASGHRNHVYLLHLTGSDT